MTHIIRLLRKPQILLIPLILTISSCRTPPEKEILEPVPTGSLGFSEILVRARGQAHQALEAFYVDGWAKMEESAVGLEETMRYLPRSQNIPAVVQETVNADAEAIGKEATRLVSAARAKDIPTATQALQKIHYKIRSLQMTQ